MNSGRGAKGSVNDRIISFLYRKRYLEYLKKKENYNKEERERAIDYLKRIKEFDIDNNVEVLDDTDKDLLHNEYDDLEEKSFLEKPELDYVNDNIESKKGYDDVKNISNISDKPIVETKEQIPSVSTIQSNFDELMEASDKISEFNPYTEDYDFEKYDYYEVIQSHGGIGNEKEENTIDVETEEEKLTDEKEIIEEVQTFIDDSLIELDEVKTELKDIDNSIDDIHTEEDVNKIDERFNDVKEKLCDIKSKYDVMKEKYEFEDYEILDNLKLINAIDDYKDKASLEEIELMVDACKYELEAIDGVEIQEEKKVGISNDIKKKNKIIKQRDKSFKQKKENIKYVNDEDLLISKEMIEQQRIIADLDIQIAKIKTETKVITEYVYHTGLMFSSFLRISAGILIAPLSRIGLFRTKLGTNLINRGLEDLKSSLIPEEKTRVEVTYKYKSVENEILNAKDEVNSTMRLIDNSIEQIESIKEYFKTHFDKEAQYIPNYYEVKSMMLDLEKTLYLKKEEIKMMDNKLNQQYDKNKQKVLKANN